MSDPPRPRRGLAGSLGDLARRVGTLVSEVSEQVTLPEEVRATLAHVRELRASGDAAAAVAATRDALVKRPGQTELGTALGLASALEIFLVPSSPSSEGGDAAGVPSPAVHLWRAAAAIAAGHADAALDELRRLRGAPSPWLTADEREADALAFACAGWAHLVRGDAERAVLELERARGRWSFAPGTTGELRWLELWSEASLLEGRAHDVAALLTAHGPVEEADPRLAALLARAAACRGDAAWERAWRRFAATSPSAAARELRVRCCLCARVPVPGETLLAVAEPPETDATAARMFALARLAGHPEAPSRAPPEPRDTTAILDALLRAVEVAPPRRRVGRIAELAHAALRLCAQAPPPAVLQALRDVDAAECRLALALFDPAAQTRAQRVAASGAEPVVAAPDPESPLGDVVVREAVCSGARALVAASAALDAGQRDVAREALTTALVAAPLLPAVAQLVPRLLAEEPTVRLEDRLQRATSLLAGLPAQLEGVDVRGASAALAEVVAARERLARPLTIAIMGEFSAGKSTLVNALLGEDLAPMGVLPTTATINVFRWGRERGAQVHDRDGHVVDLRGDDVGSFLRGLDAEAAATIHHVEIRRTGVRLGDAAVVDTPGLNALDAWHERVAREFLDEADAVVWVFSATRGGVASEGTLLAALRASSRCVLGALNKADILDEAERGELTAYLREHLGEVLADVVPVSASRALQERLAGRFDDPDFARFEQALERSFLHRARDLKREVTIHRLAGALRRAIQGLEDTEAALLASAPPHDDEADARAIRGLVTHCGDELTRRICEGDDALLRECLSLGLLRAGNAAAGLEVPDPEVDRPDLAYLARFVRRGVVSAVAAALTTPAASGGAPGEPEDPRMTAARAELATWLLPWIEGHVAGAVDGARVAQWLERAAAGDRTELARRESLRLRLAAVAQACREHLDAGTPAWLRARASAARERASAPRRAAARLRLVERAALTVLLEAGAPT